MRIWDVFPYWREAWAIKARLRLWEKLAPGADYRPVALVGDRTHRGSPLPSGLPAANELCTTVQVTLDAESDWGREEQQRDAVLTLVPEMDPRDIVLMTDADELVDPRRLSDIVYTTARRPSNLVMSLYFYGTRWRSDAEWWHPFACRAKDLPPTPSRTLRREPALPRIDKAGWHIAYVGDTSQKLAAFAHSEFDTPEHRAMIEQHAAAHVGPFGGSQLLDDSLPTEISVMIGV